MPTQVKKKSAKKNPLKKKTPKSKKSVKVIDFDNDPYFRKKDDDAQAFLEKHGFPKELL